MSGREGHLTENGRKVAEYLFSPCCYHGCTVIRLFALLLRDQCPWAGCAGDGTLPFVLTEDVAQKQFDPYPSSHKKCGLAFASHWTLSLAAVSLGYIAKAGFKAQPDVCNSSVTLYWITSNSTNRVWGEGVYRGRGGKKNHVQGSLCKNTALSLLSYIWGTSNSRGETGQLLVAPCVETGP